MVTLASVDFPYMAMHLDERLERLERLAWRRSRQPPFQNLSNLSNLLTHPRRAQMKTSCGIVACLFMMARPELMAFTLENTKCSVSVLR